MNFDLEARKHKSRVLTSWLRTDPNGEKHRSLQNAGTVVSSNASGMADIFQWVPPASGFAVTDSTAMQVSTVYACLTKLGGSISQLPAEQYRLLPDGTREQAARSRLWWLLNESPNNLWTSASWKEWIVRCVALRGDQFTEIVRSKAASSYGEIIEFKVHHPELVLPRYVQAPDGSLMVVYDVQDIYTFKMRTVDSADMLHFTGFGFNGLRSLSIIQYAARNSISNSLASGDYVGRSIGEGAMPQIALKYPKTMTKEQRQALRDSFVETYGSGTGARKLPLVLSEGADVSELSMTPVDMELMASRQYDREDICHAFGVPPVLIGDNSKTSSWGTGIEQITLGFVKFTIKPHLRRWSEELNRKLFRNAGPFVEFDLTELLRGDSKSLSEWYRSALGGPGSGDGWMTVNQVRKSQNMAPAPESDKLFKATDVAAKAHDDANAAKKKTATKEKENATE